MTPEPALDLLGHYGADDQVLHFGEECYRRRDVEREMGDWQRRWPRRAKLLVAVSRPRSHPRLLCAYLAALAAGHAVVLHDEADRPPSDPESLAARFDPDVVVDAAGDVSTRPARAHEAPLHPDLALLLPTSGSGGRRKVVRLTYANLAANAAAIAAATGIVTGDRVITSLPMDYAFGLSLVNSHLVGGAGVVLTELRPAGVEHWQAAAAHRVTTVGVVPSTCAFLARSRWDPGATVQLRQLLVAGGHTAAATLRALATALARHDAGVVPMYGQAEATARISCLPAAEVAQHAESVGRPVPGTTVRIVGDGQIEVTGPGVMSGYGLERADLALGDTQGPTLLTGDTGYLRDGRLYVTGRVDRLVKIFGRKVDLDAVQSALSDLAGTVVALDQGESTLVIVAELAPHSPDAADIRAAAAEAAGVPAGCVRVRQVERVPLTSSGKIAYGKVRDLL